MNDLLSIALDEQIQEVEREIALRKRVYPRWIAQGQLAQAKADRQLVLMKKVAETLTALRREAR